jgi:hypothetical protein
MQFELEIKLDEQLSLLIYAEATATAVTTMSIIEED